MTTAAPGTGPPPGTGSATGGDPVGRPEALPPWFTVGLVAALAALLAFGTVGLALAVVGAMAPAPTLGLGAVATVALVRAVAPWRSAGRATRVDRAVHGPAGLAVALAAGAVGFAVRHHAQHVLIDRDPGGYVATGRWLATHHDLIVHTRVGAFAQTGKLAYASNAMYAHGRGAVDFQFSHLLPVLLAQARWIGGDRLLFFTPALLGGLGLLAFYALATRFVQPWLALAATAALAADLVTVHFMRDAYSELVAQVLLLGALWLLTRDADPTDPTDPTRPARAPIAAAATAGLTGALLGATVMARIDGPLYLVVVPIVLGGAMIERRRDPAAVHLATAWWFAGGAAATSALGYLDVSLRSPEYLRHVGVRVSLQYAGLALAAVVAIAIAVWAPKLVARAARGAAGRFADGAALAVGIGLFAMWLVRPRVQHTRGTPHNETAALQRFDHVAVDPFRHYFERSLQWQAWYVGPLTLAAGIVGVALLVRTILQGRGKRAGLAVVVFLPVTAVYLWNPSIFPDQIWVMRRYLPIVIPGFILFAFVVVECLWRLRGNDTTRWIARAAAAVLVIASLAWPVRTVWPVRGDTTEQGFLGPIRGICATVGPKGAVVVLPGGAPSLDQVLPQTLRSFCNVPVAVPAVARASGPGAMTSADFASLARGWRSDGRTLFVVADRAETVAAFLPGVAPVATLTAANPLFLQERLVARPDGFRNESYRFVVAAVP